jgi:hypothetical protein
MTVGEATFPEPICHRVLCDVTMCEWPSLVAGTELSDIACAVPDVVAARYWAVENCA